MKKDVFIAGLTGGLAMLVWLFVSNAVIPIKSGLIHRPAPNQLQIHQLLRENITEPGTYACPYLSREDESQLPDYRNQPVYSIVYSGYTHGQSSSAGMLTPILIIFFCSFLAAWMLSATSERVREAYLKRVLFVAGIGLIISLFDDLMQLSFGPQARDYQVFLAVNHLITWFLAGLVIAGRIKPAERGTGPA